MQNEEVVRTLLQLPSGPLNNFDKESEQDADATVTQQEGVGAAWRARFRLQQRDVWGFTPAGLIAL